MLELMLELNQQHDAALVVVTHDMAIADSMPVLWEMHQGQLQRQR
jgi:ABC-type lipoprotein export system ATPase subunit